MEVKEYPCNDIVGFDKNHNVIMATSYWDTVAAFDFDCEKIVKPGKKATNPPDIYYIYYRDVILDFCREYNHPLVVSTNLLPEHVTAVTVEPELIGICDA